MSETIRTYWVCPDASALSAQLASESPVGARQIADDYLNTRRMMLRRQMSEKGFTPTRDWIGGPLRDQLNWSDARAWYPIFFAFEGTPSPVQEAPPFNTSPLLRQHPEHYDADRLLFEAAAHMSKGDFEAGLPLYEFRNQTAQGQKQWKPTLTMPHWDGIFRAGMKLLVHAEQGYGDVIQFARYLPWLNHIGADFLCYPSLCRLLKSGNFTGKVFSSVNPDKVYDYHVPLCSLPLALDPRMEELPRSPYLRSEPDRYWAWRDRVGREGYRVGICWAGNATHTGNLARTRTIEDVIRACPKDCRLFNLQKGDARRQLTLLPDGVKVEDFTDRLGDWAETAALVDNMDLIVTVDTAIAHLAGALGRPTKLLLGEQAEWRWGQEGDRTRWYSAMVLDRKA